MPGLSFNKIFRLFMANYYLNMRFIHPSIPFILLIASFSFLSVKGQNSFEKGYEALNNAELKKAVKYFEDSKKNDEDYFSSSLSLVMLYGVLGKENLSSEKAIEYINTNNDPYPQLFSIWREKGVAGESFAKTDDQFKFLKAVEKDDRHTENLSGVINYSMGTYFMSKVNYEKSQEYYNKIGQIKNWAFLGPFDNIMNSGMNKEFGALQHPESDHIFSSIYNNKIKWFEPSGPKSNDGYIVKERYFYRENAIIYGQSFINSPSEQDVLLKIGFSGSAKLWLNDEQVLTQLEPVTTEMDFFTVKCRLNAGYNRILIQLGDYNTIYPNFIVRAFDANNKLINIENTANYKAYKKSNESNFQLIENFSLSALKQKIKENPDNDLYKVLLAKTYKRSGFYNEAEEILLNLFEKNPKNFFVLRNLIVLYSELSNNTEQNRFYGIFKENYPDFRTILINDVNDYKENANLYEVKKTVEKINELYPDDYLKIRFSIIVAEMEEDYAKVLEEIDRCYEKYPDDYNAVFTKYKITKGLKSDSDYNKILEKYLEKEYSLPISNELASNYLEEGRLDEAISLYEKSNKFVGFDADNVYKVMVFLASKKEDYNLAKNLCFDILKNRPDDYKSLVDLAIFNRLQNNNDSALFYYEKANEIFPFSFEINEKIQALKGEKTLLEILPSYKPKAIIAEFKENFAPKRKGSFDIVIDQESAVLFKSGAKGKFHSYLLRLNTEGALEDFQELNFSTTSDYNISIVDAKTFKANGNEITAEQTNNNVVFLNLEVGDYIYVNYIEKQVRGGKTSLFIEDEFSFDRNIPSYKLEYNLLVENGLNIKDTIVNGALLSNKKNIAGFTKYTYSVKNVEPLADETLAPNFNDISKTLHYSYANSWDDIVEWYSDLSTQQANSDLTIKRLATQLFKGKSKSLSDIEKAKIIYNFVCKNIQYSSIDFRQSNIIPQKASDVYHSRLGDCKDVSTLYASLAREVGLDVSLILIYTSDNGLNSVVLPSLNFNHCIVKLNLKNEALYLELTDPNLPFGHLYYFHKNAAILEIPSIEKIKQQAKLERLQFNKGYYDVVNRNNTVLIKANGDINIISECLKTGAKAASIYNSYCSKDSTEQSESLIKSIGSEFDTKVKLVEANFNLLKPLEDTARYNFHYAVENGLTKVGSFKTIKIPFSDEISKLSLFDSEDRTYEMDFNLYENTDIYKEKITLELEDGLSFIELPKNADYAYADYYYKFSVNKLADNKIEIYREFKAPRESFSVESLDDLRTFISNAMEVENTQLVMK